MFLRLSYFLPYCIVLLAWSAHAQSPIILDQCGQAYIDPQVSNNADTDQNRDTLLYTQYFAAAGQRRSYLIDVNAFSGQQVDRISVQAIMPDSSFKQLGSLAFGNCIGCVEGFALVQEDSLIVSGVMAQSTMNMWIQALGQPAFALPDNLQTLIGAGRISGTLPFCAIGLRVVGSVFSDPDITSTEFSIYIHCPEPVMECDFQPQATADCLAGLIRLDAEVPDGCLAGEYTVNWSNASGTVVDGPSGTYPLSGNEGWYYFTIADECCVLVDSFWVDNPRFADAGPDLTRCLGEPLSLSGTGGQGHFWTLPDGSQSSDSLLLLPAVEPADAGLYVLHAFNAEGCEDRDSLQLSVLVPPLPEPGYTAGCFGDTVFLFAQNDSLFVQLQWFGPDGQALPMPVLPDFQAADEGPYRLEGTDAAGCTSEAFIGVAADALPEPSYLAEETCDTTYLYFFPPELNYEWASGSGNTLATATGGDFLITVSDSLGCQVDWALSIPPPSGPEVELIIDQPICPGELGELRIVLHSQERLAIFSIDGGERYTLADRFRRLEPGPYQVVVRDALDCIQEFPITINRPDTLGVSLDQGPVEVRPTTPVSLSASTVGNVQRIQWVPEEINSGSLSTDFIATRNLDIRIIVEDDRGCLASDRLPLTVVLGEVYAPSAFSPNGDGRNDRFTVYSDLGSGEIIETFRVFDRWGGLVFEAEEVPLGDHRYGWDGTRLGKPLNTGTYAFYAKVRYPNGFRRIVKGEVHLIR